MGVNFNCSPLRRFGMDSSVKSALATRVASDDRRIWNLRKGKLSSFLRVTWE